MLKFKTPNKSRLEKKDLNIYFNVDIYFVLIYRN